MQTLLQVFHVLLAAAMIALILVQRGAGASAGASFGAGASATVFGSRGAGSFLTHATALTATGFFLVSFIMAVLAGRNAVPVDEDDLGVMSQAVPAVEETVPADAEVPQPVVETATVEAGSEEVPQAVPVEAHSETPQAVVDAEEAAPAADGGESPPE